MFLLKTTTNARQIFLQTLEGSACQVFIHFGAATLSEKALGIMTLSVTTHIVIIFRITALFIWTLGVATLIIMTFKITTLIIMIPIIMIFSITILGIMIHNVAKFSITKRSMMTLSSMKVRIMTSCLKHTVQ
jgi:hypothetical protein